MSLDLIPYRLFDGRLAVQFVDGGVSAWDKWSEGITDYRPGPKVARVLARGLPHHWANIGDYYNLRPFALRRTHDVSGVSGLGDVAHGVQWPDGQCSMRWNTAGGSFGTYDSAQKIIDIHGHGGATNIFWPALQ